MTLGSSGYGGATDVDQMQAAETLRWLAIHPQRTAASLQQRVEPLHVASTFDLVNEVSVSVR